MKKVFVFVTLFVLLALVSGAAQVQSMTVFSIRRVGPEITIFNGTDLPVRVWMNGVSQGIVRQGASGKLNNLQKRIYTYQQLSVVVETCSSAKEIDMAVEPPQWTTGDGIPKDAALTPAFLAGNPTMPDIRKKVKGLEKWLKHRPGERLMKDDLHAWVKTVEERGLIAPASVCEGAKPLQAVSVYIDPNVYSWPNVTLVARGEKKTGYYLERNN